MGNILQEEWRDIPQLINYEVSNLGNIRHKRNKNNLKTIKKDTGYLQIRIRVDGKNRTFKIHRLVASSFVPNPDNKPFVNHIDNDRTNNNASNLEWCTPKENYDWCAKQGRNTVSLENLIFKSPKAVIGTNVTTGETIYLNSMSDGKNFGFNQQNISACCAGKEKTHHGYTWRYA